ncbi:MAG: hypothetical protein K9G41_12420 [Flavobacteriales bacterium]|nr:hypothetical protein [Flavobacteriales bacterium]
MARTQDEIYQAYYTELQAQTPLADLVPQADDAQTLLTDISTPSKVAQHRLELRWYSFFSWMLEVLFDAYKAEVQTIADANKFGTLRWWAAKLKAYQHGFALSFVENFAQYVDTTSSTALLNQVVKYSAAVQNSNGEVILKAAADDGNGNPVALTNAELTGLGEYCDQLQPAGVRLILISQNADLLMVTGTVYYNPLVLDEFGYLISDGTTRPVDDAIEAYIDGLPFNGRLSTTTLKDVVQLAEGVNDFVPSAIEYKIGTGNWTLINRLYDTFSGYIRVSSAVGETLPETIGYVAGE